MQWWSCARCTTPETRTLLALARKREGYREVLPLRPAKLRRPRSTGYLVVEELLEDPALPPELDEPLLMPPPGVESLLEPPPLVPLLDIEPPDDVSLGLVDELEDVEPGELGVVVDDEDELPGLVSFVVVDELLDAPGGPGTTVVEDSFFSHAESESANAPITANRQLLRLIFTLLSSEVRCKCTRWLANAVPLQTVDHGRANEKLLLVEALFQRPSILRPPCPVELIDHNLEHNDFVALDSAVSLFRPRPVSGRTEVCGKATVLLRQLVAHAREALMCETPPCIVVKRQQQLNEVHA